jgi:hypothetical protein
VPAVAKSDGRHAPGVTGPRVVRHHVAVHPSPDGVEPTDAEPSPAASAEVEPPAPGPAAPPAARPPAAPPGGPPGALDPGAAVPPAPGPAAPSGAEAGAGEAGAGEAATATAILDPAVRRRHELWEAHARLGRDVDADALPQDRLAALLELTDDVLRLEADDRERARAARHRVATAVLQASAGLLAVLGAASLIVAAIAGWARAWTVAGLLAAVLTGVGLLAVHRVRGRDGDAHRAGYAVAAVGIGVLLAGMAPYLPKWWAVALMMVAWAGLLVASWAGPPAPGTGG